MASAVADASDAFDFLVPRSVQGSPLTVTVALVDAGFSRWSATAADVRAGGDAIVLHLARTADAETLSATQLHAPGAAAPAEAK